VRGSSQSKTPYPDALYLSRGLTLCIGHAMLAGLMEAIMAEPRPEKRATRRFALRLPVAVSYGDNGTQEKTAQTRDVSARGICFYVDASISSGAPIEFTLTLPPEITLTEAIRVRCKGKVVRVDSMGANGKVAVAAVIDEYEFLSESQP
jgi:PilZ domain-containing protein